MSALSFIWNILRAAFVLQFVCAMSAPPASGADSGLDTPTGVADLPFSIQGTQIMSLTGTGLGIGGGGIDPTQALDVSGYVRIRAINGEGGTIQMDGNNGTTMWLENLNGTFRLVNSPWNAQLFSVDQSGNVTANGNVAVGNNGSVNISSGGLTIGNNGGSWNYRLWLANGDGNHFLLSTGSGANQTVLGEYGGWFGLYDTSNGQWGAYFSGDQNLTVGNGSGPGYLHLWGSTVDDTGDDLHLDSPKVTINNSGNNNAQLCLNGNCTTTLAVTPTVVMYDAGNQCTQAATSVSCPSGTHAVGGGGFCGSGGGFNHYLYLSEPSGNPPTGWTAGCTYCSGGGCSCGDLQAWAVCQ